MPDPAAIAQASAVFAKDVGEWDIALVIRPAPGAPAIEQKGFASNRLVANRWLVVDHRTESGFEGHGVYGWDANLGRYTGIWVDGAGAGIVRAEGTWDPATRTMTYACETVHEGRPHRYREITTTRPDGSQFYRHLVAMPDGIEHELITATYTRRGDPADPTSLPGSGPLRPTTVW